MHTVVAEVNRLKIVEVRKRIRNDFRNLIFFQPNVNERKKKRVRGDACDQIVARVQNLQAEVFEAVKVAQISDQVVAEVETCERRRQESVVEPIDLIGRHVEPFECGQM